MRNAPARAGAFPIEPIKVYFASASAAVNLSSASLRKLVRTPEGDPNSINWSVLASYFGQAGPDAHLGSPVLAKAAQHECISTAIALSSSDGSGGAGGAA